MAVRLYQQLEMHEIGIITQAVEIAIEAARKEGARRVIRLRLKIGAMSGVVPDALAFGFELVTQGTCAEGASLEIEPVPITCNCATGCGTFTPDDYIFRCPVCGLLSSDVASGREMDVVEIEVAD